MAKNPEDDNIDLGDIDYDDSLDLDMNLGGESDKPKEGVREVSKASIQSFNEAIKETLTDSSYKRKLAGIMMPKGYSQAFNAYDSSVSAVKQIYTENEGELRPFLAKANRLLAKRTGRFKNLLPKGLKDLLQSADDKENQGSDRRESELDSNLSGLNDLFKFEVANKAEKVIEDNRKEFKDDKKYKLNLEHLQNISGGMSRLVAYQDQINIAYQRKNLEIGFRQYDIQRKLLVTTATYHKDAITRLDGIAKNTGLPDYVKLKSTEAIKGRLREKLADSAMSKLDQFRQNYLKDITSGFSSAIGGAASSIGMMSGMMSQASESGMSKSEMIGGQVGAMVGGKVKENIGVAGEHVASMMAPIIARMPGVKDKGDELSIMFADPIGYLSRWAQSDTDSTGIGSMISGIIKPMLPQYSEKGRIESIGVAGLQDPAVFDNLFYSTVTQVMPKYMESMERSLRSLVSGKVEETHAYSHYTQSMVTRDTLDDQNWRIGVLKGQKDIVKDEVESLLGKLGADGLSDDAKRTLGLRLIKDMRSNHNFDPTDYTKVDSWAGADESVSEELQDFFAEKFDIDIEGKMSKANVGFLSEVMTHFSTARTRLPDIAEAVEALTQANIMDRESLRRKGLTTFDGVGGDVINVDALNTLLLGEGSLTAKKDDIPVDTESRSWKDTFKAMSDEVKGRIEAEEAYRKELAEKHLQESSNDRIDVGRTQSGGIQSIRSTQLNHPFANTGTRSPLEAGEDNPFAGTQSLKGLSGAKAVFRVRDQGTYTRLDRLLERLGEPSESTGGGAGEELAATINSGVGKVKKLASTTKDRAKDLALDIKARTDKWYRESPKVQAVVDRVEKEYGKITDPNARMELIEKVYKTTGTPEEIHSKLSSAGEYVGGKYQKAKSYLSDLYSRKDEWVELVSDTYTSTKTKVKDKAVDVKDIVKEMYGARDEYIAAADKRIGDMKERIIESGSRVAEKSKSRLGKGLDFVKGLKPGFGLSDRGTHLRLDGTNRLLFTLLQRQGYEGRFESLVPPITQEDLRSEKPKRGIVGKAMSAVKWTIGKGMDATGMMAKGYAGAVKGAAGVVGSVGSALIGNKTWGVRDVMVIGEKKPRLRAVDIRNGKYVDKESKKVISKLKDIKGPVIEVETGNEVISQEEIDQKLLVDGKGDSLVGLLSRGAVNLSGKAAMMSAAYLGGAYGVLGAIGVGAAKLAIKVVKDQMTQFDAYIPGDPKPRIRSKLMQQGHYRDDKGEPIMSLDKINGPVYDLDGNEIISQEEITKYKSLYSQNGSMLFTFGRGMASATGWMARKAFNYYVGTTKALFKGSMKIAKGIGSGITKAGKGLLNLGLRALGYRKSKLTLDGSNQGDGYANDILMEQLRIQDAILKEMQQRAKESSKGDGPKWDSDGDGVRDNSWLDVMARRNKRKARGPNADVVDAINSMNDNLENAIGDMGDKGPGMMSKMVDGLKGLGATILGALGIKSALGSLGGGGGPGGGGQQGGGWKKRAARGLFNAAKWTGKTALRVGWGAAKFGVQRLAWPALVGAVKVGGAIVAAVGWPVVLVGLAIGAVGYVGWSMWKKYKAKQKPLHFLRMIQYGINGRDGDRVEQILQLETLMGNAIAGIDTDSPDLVTKKVDFKKVYQIFGLLKTPKEGEEPNPEEEEELDEDRAKSLIHWIAYRFKPVYLKHIAALNSLAKQQDLNKVDEVINTKGKMHKYLDVTTLANMTDVYDKLKSMTPFKSKLTHNSKDVKNWLIECRKVADKYPDDVKKTEGESDDGTKDVSSEGPKVDSGETTDDPVEKDVKEDTSTTTDVAGNPVSKTKATATQIKIAEAKLAHAKRVKRHLEENPSKDDDGSDLEKAIKDIEDKEKALAVALGKDPNTVSKASTVKDSDVRDDQPTTKENVPTRGTDMEIKVARERLEIAKYKLRQLERNLPEEGGEEALDAAIHHYADRQDELDVALGRKAKPTREEPSRGRVREIRTLTKPSVKAPISTEVAAPVSVEVNDRYSPVAEDIEIKAPAKASQDISRSIEMSGMTALHSTMTSSTNLLSTAVQTLGNMDSTLIAIHGEMQKMNLIKESKVINGESSTVNDPAGEELAANLRKLSGETLKQIQDAAKADASKNVYRQRSNPSPARTLAIT